MSIKSKLISIFVSSIFIFLMTILSIQTAMACPAVDESVTVNRDSK
jgi:hypothetical protein